MTTSKTPNPMTKDKSASKTNGDNASNSTPNKKLSTDPSSKPAGSTSTNRK